MLDLPARGLPADQFRLKHVRGIEDPDPAPARSPRRPSPVNVVERHLQMGRPAQENDRGTCRGVPRVGAVVLQPLGQMRIAVSVDAIVVLLDEPHDREPGVGWYTARLSGGIARVRGSFIPGIEMRGQHRVAGRVPARAPVVGVVGGTKLRAARKVHLGTHVRMPVSRIRWSRATSSGEAVVTQRCEPGLSLGAAHPPVPQAETGNLARGLYATGRCPTSRCARWATATRVLVERELWPRLATPRSRPRRCAGRVEVRARRSRQVIEALDSPGLLKRSEDLFGLPGGMTRWPAAVVDTLGVAACRVAPLGSLQRLHYAGPGVIAW